MEEVVAALNGKFGSLPKDRPIGKLVDEWNSA